jgi:hypothetical protein
MKKTKIIMKIESFIHKDGMLLLSVSDYGVRSLLKNLTELCSVKHGGYMQLEVSPPYKKRSTGDKSQNNLIWKLITIIAQETGNEIEDVEIGAKERAIKRGYPFHQNKFTGKPMPESMKKINTVEAGYLIDELYAIANELEIKLDD